QIIMSLKNVNISRRHFVIGSASAGMGLSLGLSLPLGLQAADKQSVPEVNAWVVIAPDDTVTIRIARSEMGQGTLTGLAQMVAEELQCDWDRVTTEYPTPGENLRRDRVWKDFSTGGSRGIRGSHQYVREGGAAAREMLIAAAAKQWRVAATECSAANSVITHGPSGRTTTFGKVATAAASMSPPQQVTLKDPKDWQLIGQPVKRLDTRDKLTGKQQYSSDIRLPGMVNATIRACPVHGGKRVSFNAEKALKMPGVKSVVPVEDNAVAVIAETFWQAKMAMDAVEIEWDKGENGKVSSADIDKMLEEGLTADTEFVGNSNGDFASAIKSAAKTYSADYGYPFQNHATMEPMTATAVWNSDRCEVWCPTQNGEAALAATISASGLAPEQCEVYKMLLGGGFGRRGAADYVTQAVLIAKTMPGTPVKLIWTREEDMLHGFFHPVTKARLTAGFDEQGELDALHIRISGQSILAGLYPERLGGNMDPVVFQVVAKEGEHGFSYSVNNLLVDHAMRNPHIRPGFWRGVNANQNAIYVECFMDELAHETGQDPLTFRRKLMKDHPLSLAVLNKVADMAEWDKPAPQGRFRGLAVCKAFDSYVAACAEVSVTNGTLKIHRIFAATDPGYAVNPQQIEAQVAGSFVYGLSAMLYGGCTVKDGEIEQQNFHTFPSMRIAEMPEVQVSVMPSGGFWGGVGEPTIAVAAPAVLNAIFAATGKRIRDLPLKNHSLA
ncbi:MAG: xanthine dehydrogenase family protein molybdopterin-binding subunit, partial [Pseudomonadales bacterium]|nr:xanthine dehydrogenase family protein molybdopterin-binding subunit [Pseudomonadales bacterium]